MMLLKQVDTRGGGILFLSNNRNAFVLYDWLKSQEERVYFYSGKLTESQITYLDPALIVSYNYSFLVPADIISLVEDKIVNMHISYLPWNKGSDPNFWSFIENTPKGVTIHQLSAGLDRGAILVQKELFFDEAVETFRSTYEKLNQEIVSLFQENFEKIKNRELLPAAQCGSGSYHKRSDFLCFTGGGAMDWEERIEVFKQRRDVLDGRGS